MNQENFEIAIKPQFNVDAELEFSRYFRVIFGQEAFQWENGAYRIINTIKEGKICGYDGFRTSKTDLENLGIVDKAYCPNLEENFYIRG